MPLRGGRDRADQHLRARAGEHRPAVVLGDPVAVVAEAVGQPREVDRVRCSACAPLEPSEIGLVEDAEATRVTSAHGRAGARGRARGAVQGSAGPDGSGKASGPARRIPLAMVTLGIDPGTAHTGYGVVARRDGRLVALDGGVIETAAGLDPGARLALSTPASARCSRSTTRRPRRGGPLLRRQRPLGVRGRAGARRRHARRRPARRAVLLLHAPAGQGRRLRLRPGRQGAGAADGPGAARPDGAAARPTTRRTRSRSPSAMRTARRCAPPSGGPRHDRAALAARSPCGARTMSWSAAAASATGSRCRPRRCARCRRPAARHAAHAPDRARRRAARSTASPPRPSATSSCC